MAALRALERKYGDVESYLEDARARLSRLENLDEETADLERRVADGERRLSGLAEALTAGREKAAKRLASKVQENLAGLNLGRTEFHARLIPSEPGPTGTATPSSRAGWSGAAPFWPRVARRCRCWRCAIRRWTCRSSTWAATRPGPSPCSSMRAATSTGPVRSSTCPSWRAIRTGVRCPCPPAAVRSAPGLNMPPHVTGPGSAQPHPHSSAPPMPPHPHGPPPPPPHMRGYPQPPMMHRQPHPGLPHPARACTVQYAVHLQGLYDGVLLLQLLLQAGSVLVEPALAHADAFQGAPQAAPHALHQTSRS